MARARACAPPHTLTTHSHIQMAMSDFKATLAARFPSLNVKGSCAAHPGFHLKERDCHFYFAARAGARDHVMQLPRHKVFDDEEEYNLGDLLGNVMPSQEGWVGCASRHDSPRVDGYYTNPDNTTHTPAPPLYTGVSTVADEQTGARARARLL